MTDYYSIQAASASLLKELARLPAHAYAKYLDPNRPPDEPTPAQLLGTQTHAAILEPAEFDNRYTVMPEGLDRRSKEGKAVYAAILESGKQPVSAGDMSLIHAMRDSVHAHPVSQLIWGLPHHVEIPYKLKLNGTPAKMKPDLIIEPCSEYPRGLILDLKTTTDASADAFGRAVFNLKYYIQAAFYTDCYRVLYGTTPDFMWLAVESRRPHLCAYYKAPEAVIEYGHDVYSDLMEIYRECMRTGNWYGYNDAVTDLQIPGWAMHESEPELTITEG